MKQKRSWLKTIGLGICVLIATVAITICPPIEKSYAGHHGGGNLGYGLAGAALGACATAAVMQNQQQQPPTTVVVQGCGEGMVSYNGGCFTPDQCYQVKQVLSDQYGNYIRTVYNTECQ